MRKATNGFKKPEPPQAPIVKPVPLALNIHAAVEYTGLTNNHIEEALRAGKIPHKKVGSWKYMDRTDLDTYWRSLPYETGNERLRSLPNGELRTELYELYKRKVKFSKPDAIAKIKALASARGIRLSDKQLAGISGYEEWFIE